MATVAGVGAAAPVLSGYPSYGVQTYLPPEFAPESQPRKLPPEQQEKFDKALQRPFPERWIKPSFSTELHQLVCSAVELGAINGVVTGAIGLVGSALWQKAMHGKVNAAWTAIATIGSGLAAGVGTYFNRRAYNENVMDAATRGATTYRQLLADPVFHSGYVSAGANNSVGSTLNTLANGMYLASTMRSMADLSRGYSSSRNS